MSLTLKPKSPGASGANARHELSSLPEYDCCVPNEHQRSLILTQADGATGGFPLTWLYRWQWKKPATHELLTITLTEHEVTIHGKNLERIIEFLGKGTGLHLKVKDDRYQGLLRPNETHITHITVQPHEKAHPSAHQQDQS